MAKITEPKTIFNDYVTFNWPPTIVRAANIENYLLTMRKTKNQSSKYAPLSPVNAASLVIRRGDVPAKCRKYIRIGEK